MKLYQVKGTPNSKVELLEATTEGKVKVRSLLNNEIIETTQQVFEMAFEPSAYSAADFEKARERAKNTKISQKDIDTILEKSQIETINLFGRCTIVAIQLQNGFIITESSESIDNATYNKEVQTQICLDRIKNRIWELEGYKLQSILSES